MNTLIEHFNTHCLELLSTVLIKLDEPLNQLYDVIDSNTTHGNFKYGLDKKSASKPITTVETLDCRKKMITDHTWHFPSITDFNFDPLYGKMIYIYIIVCSAL